MFFIFVFQALFARRMRDPIGPELEGDRQVVDALLNILSKEEQASGLPPSPELLGVADIRRPNKTDNFRSNRRPNSDARAQFVPNSKPNSRPNSRQANQYPNQFRDGGEARNWQADWRHDSARSATGPFPPYRYDGRGNGKGKDLGNLRYKTGNADIDFMARSSGPANRSEQDRGQWARNDMSRASSLRDNGGPSTVNKGWRSEGDARNRNGYNAKKKFQSSMDTAGRSRANQTFNPPFDSLPQQPMRLMSQSAGKSPSEGQATKYTHDQSRKVFPKESAQFVQGSGSR